MFKKIAGIGLSLCMLLSTSAFAVTTSTTTKYASDGKISVITSVKGAEAGSKLTYLTFKNSGNTLSSLKGDEIVYVDQYTLASDETSHDFSYTTSDANISSKVLVGGSDITAPVDDSVLGYVEIKEGSGGDSITTGSIISGGSEKIESDILYKVELDSPCNIKSIDKINNDLDVENALCFIGSAKEMWISGSLLKEGGATEIFVEKNTTSSVATLGINTSTYTESTDSYAAISVYGQVIGSPGSFGVIISRSSIDTSSINSTVWSADTDLNSANAIAFPALGRNAEGGYVVQIADDSLKGSTVYACAYSCSDGVYTFGDIKNVSVSQ